MHTNRHTTPVSRTFGRRLLRPRASHCRTRRPLRWPSGAPRRGSSR
jgi:hypothetical protein